jgi:hypothetical protein
MFKLATTDPTSMPPKCCTIEIDFDMLPERWQKHFSEKFRKAFMRKKVEGVTKNRIYCIKEGCGNWIRPKYIEENRKSERHKGVCSRCKTEVCGECNMKWHPEGDCIVDKETERILNLAKEQENFQRCYRCGEMVEKESGCNHMTCRCGAESAFSVARNGESARTFAL